MAKFNFKKGETVKVIAGEDKGKQGRVLAVLPNKHRAIVEGLNMISKHTKPLEKLNGSACSILLNSSPRGQFRFKNGRKCLIINTSIPFVMESSTIGMIYN